jgi:CCR4-NOT transcription complex subunit 9
METGSELSKTVAIFIVQKILLDDIGLAYICATYERFYAVGTVLSNMVTQLVEQQTVRLLKHVVRCFLRYVIFFSCLWSVSDFDLGPSSNN